jgi:hypothetical protein
MRQISFVSVLLVLSVLLVPAAAAQDDMMASAVHVNLAPTPFAEGADLAGVTGYAHVESDNGYIHIVLEPNGATLVEGAALEGWLVDAGTFGGPGATNVTVDDQTFGPPFGDLAFDVLVSAAPYALSTGGLAPDDDNWAVEFEVPAYNFSAYDAVVITLESDGNAADGFDPRPGAPVFAGEIAMGEPAEAMDMMMDEGMMEEEMDMMSMGAEITLAATPLAANAGLEGITGAATVYDSDAMIGNYR